MDDGPVRGFEAMMASIDSSVYLVTAAADGRRAGCLVGFAAQMSIEPERFVAGISRQNHTYPIAAATGHLGVHVVSREHLDLVRLFGGETGDEVDKFERCRWVPGPHGVPILSDAEAWFVGRVLARHDVGDHTCHVLAPVAGGGSAGGRGGLAGLADVDDLEPGHPA
ncbi:MULTISPECIES: flavin reductase family protein [Gordonia]|uniref:Flavin reductase family protein n=1 Tax=Gordonia cholesterolivorans TaxID=559625 RepID=A0ABN3H2D2_9ACTN|nr:MULTISPECIES: flavin reductase family protein [Gordonia]KJR05875.1 oxidoreductase [Gordonia sihwensis]KXT57112.1 oxidoreductase [Gordonia sp. QH-12]